MTICPITLIRSFLFICVAQILGIAGYAQADMRDDVRSAHMRLRQSGISRKLPDEIKSLESTIELAERYTKNGDQSLADRYFLLAIQKIRIIETMPQDDITPPVQSQQTSTTAASIPEPVSTQPHPAKPPLTRPVIQPAPTVAVQPREKYEPAVELVPDNIKSEKLVGNIDYYTVEKGETLRVVAAKLGVSRRHLTRMNSIDAKGTIKAGQKLKYNNRKIIPHRITEGIVINIPDRTLYYFKQGKLASYLPVALGVATKSEKYNWETPTGKFRIIAKQKDPTWTVPPSIQSEMEEQGKEVITSVPPGPDNPLGKYAMKTSLPGILIHSTTKPWSIYSFASHGCIRVYPSHMEGFFKEVKVNTPGEIIYRPVKIALTEEGRVFLEVHNDVYGKTDGLGWETKQLIRKHNLDNRVNWKKVEAVIKHKSGIAEDVTL